MKRFAHIWLVLVACASSPRSSSIDHARFDGFAVEPVREAARVVVEELAHRWSVVRITDEGSVMTEGRIGVCGEHVTCAIGIGHPANRGITPWATIEVRFHELGDDTSVDVEIVYEDCDPGVDCQPELLASTGGLERRIIDGMRDRLEADRRS